MCERRKQNTKADGRSNSINRKNGYRNYASGPVWDHRRKDDYRYNAPQQGNYREGFNQRHDYATSYPPDYHHANNSQESWVNDTRGGTAGGSNGIPTYYSQMSKYSGEHLNKNYGQHPHIYAPQQYDYVASAGAIQEANVTWQQHNHRFLHSNKRRQDSDGPASCSHNLENNHKTKKKKPLSQNVPAKREWTIDDAKKAINVEMEFSKRFKQNSLMIKFPDIDINKEIVSKFHTAIENVHFQQPSTARYCFVTLNDHADGDLVIKALNTTKFGQGYLTAEYKKERDNQIVSPEDIDPLTLYVGNLAQEITKQDLEQIYTNKKRIDIGFAMKMKKTRYAFISFWNVEDSIEAYTRTRSDVLYSKSLIVRFRRLHGTVGLPGEPKLQNPPKSTAISHTDHRNEDAHSSGDEHSSANLSLLTDISGYTEEVDEENLSESTRRNLSKSLQQNCHSDNKKEDGYNNGITNPLKVDLTLVKQEKPEDVNHDGESNTKDPVKTTKETDCDIKPDISQFDSPFLPTYVINELMIQHTPIKEELSPCETSVSQGNELAETKEPECRPNLHDESNNSENENSFEFEMDMVSNVDFNSIYKYIPPKPGS